MFTPHYLQLIPSILQGSSCSYIKCLHLISKVTLSISKNCICGMQFEGHCGDYTALRYKGIWSNISFLSSMVRRSFKTALLIDSNHKCLLLILLELVKCYLHFILLSLTKAPLYQNKGSICSDNSQFKITSLLLKTLSKQPCLCWKACSSSPLGLCIRAHRQWQLPDTSCCVQGLERDKVNKTLYRCRAIQSRASL